jgi:hypothetical protein
MRIWIASYPRSGSRFSRTVLKDVYGASSYTAYQKNADRDPNRKPRMGTLTWEGEIVPEPPSDERPPFSECVFMKTHELPLADDHSPAIYVVRDGRDSYVSYAHFALLRQPKDAPPVPYEDMLRMLIQSTDHFHGWSTHASGWLDYPGPTAILRYEDMSVDAAGAVAQALRDINVEVPSPVGQMPAFEDLREGHAHILRKGRTGSWREEMSPELEELFWSIHGGTMERLGYPR